jgi:PadR family transcriptional regulator, regulatory protein PadR
MDGTHGAGPDGCESRGGSRPCCRRAGGSGRGGALVEPAALAALLSAAAHGYDLRREIREITQGALEVDAGGLYRVLRKLEQDGFVTSAWAQGESGPQRRDYELTAEGRELAEDWAMQLRQRQSLAGRLADALSGALGTDSPTAK